MITKFKIFENKTNQRDIDEILKEYLVGALWSNDFDDKSISDIADSSIDDARKEITWFVNSAGKYIDKIPNDEIGHDIWLTRNGHGTGFWDRGYSDKKTELLKHLCKLLGTADAYIGDDDKIYIDSYRELKPFNVREYMLNKKYKGTIKKYNL